MPKRKHSNDYGKISLVCRFWSFLVNFHTCTSFFWDKENLKFPSILEIWSIAFQKKKTELKNLSYNCLSDELKSRS